MCVVCTPSTGTQSVSIHNFLSLILYLNRECFVGLISSRSTLFIMLKSITHNSADFLLQSAQTVEREKLNVKMIFAVRFYCAILTTAEQNIYIFIKTA